MVDFLDPTKSFPWVLLVGGLLIMAVGTHIFRHFTHKNKVRTGRATGKIVGVCKKDDSDGCPVYYPVIEFFVDNQLYTTTSILGESSEKSSHLTGSSNVMVRFDPSNPADADLDSPRFDRIYVFAIYYSLFLGLTLVFVGIWFLLPG
jgi:hypothetical protein